MCEAASSTYPNVGIIGTGQMGSALARAFARGGVPVMIGSRSQSRGESVAASLCTEGVEIRGGSHAEVVAWAQLLFLVVPFLPESDGDNGWVVRDGVAEFLEHQRDNITGKGKCFVDLTNASTCFTGSDPAKFNRVPEGVNVVGGFDSAVEYHSHLLRDGSSSWGAAYKVIWSKSVDEGKVQPVEVAADARCMDLLKRVIPSHGFSVLEVGKHIYMGLTAASYSSLEKARELEPRGPHRVKHAECSQSAVQ